MVLNRDLSSIGDITPIFGVHVVPKGVVAIWYFCVAMCLETLCIAVHSLGPLC